ncbi:MAG: tRNA1(Val) (adenine(37)-N6)-methyltransferase [Firmicutes bacterium]|jgi:tRNA1Val (adenine37-N6)-methyltransferase|nr:tRNA1(Val) (adenine(37)-N6)-methyltransferase [Bacillota bacterium]
MGARDEPPVESGALVREHERVDDLQRSGLRIIQDPTRFRFSMDAVLLAEFARVRAGDRCIDLGTGTGVIPLLLSARGNPAEIVGLEILEDVADMARRSVRLNGLSDKISIIHGDLKEAVGMFGAESFDVALSNPPYIRADRGTVNLTDELAVAKHEIACTLEDVVQAAGRLVRSRGRVAMVHRPGRLVDLLVLMRGAGLEPRRLRFVQARMGQAPMMVLVEAVKGACPDLAVQPPLILYGEDGSYTPEANRIYFGP